ncbi:PTS sugar transporter subunit IIA [Mediterraneibacter gnavus]|uniref:PTS sugar transporter subunit IIA n=1 Tax=Mediterraneibacter gnavus TaxID=33038 RepID=UPI00232DA743|nr:PTS fructose transporter subunit IIA [Mediterraneibacter gnavus]MDB8710063.1 PTS fructose transporter subunit IIA [Mediterraneibacter gnavus]MDB8713468.1 PTS fructose transporter subunit IIA [Mediterraneibacter gnavus]
MSNLVLASHGSLAEGMKSALKMILGESIRVDAFGLDRWEQPQVILEEIIKLRNAEPDEEIIVLCDIKGGSVCNCMMQLCTDPKICVISGMNLGLALELSMISGGVSCREEIENAIKESKESIQYFDHTVMQSLTEAEEEKEELW